jgi:hypothetical protein
LGKYSKPICGASNRSPAAGFAKISFKGFGRNFIQGDRRANLPLPQKTPSCPQQSGIAKIKSGKERSLPTSSQTTLHAAQAAGRRFSPDSNQMGPRGFHGSLGNCLQERSVCDYSLHAVASRPAEVAVTLVSTKFQSTTTRGFANPDSPTVAVCLRPGTEIAFEADARADGFLFRRNVHARLARFRHYAGQHHDALEFSNGAIVLLTNLTPGQRAVVLQLPASPVEPKPGTSEHVVQELAET